MVTTPVGSQFVVCSAVVSVQLQAVLVRCITTGWAKRSDPNVQAYNEHNASARGVKMITISRAQRGNSITEPTAQQEVLLVI